MPELTHAEYYSKNIGETLLKLKFELVKLEIPNDNHELNISKKEIIKEKNEIYNLIEHCETKVIVKEYPEVLDKTTRLVDSLKKHIQYYDLTELNHELIEKIMRMINDLQHAIASLGQLEIINESDLKNERQAKDAETKLKVLLSQFNKQKSAIEFVSKFLNENKNEIDKRLEKADEKISEIEHLILNKTADIDDLYNEEIKQLKEKRDAIDETFSIAAGSILSGGYEKQAKNEFIAAEITRAIAVILMGVIVWKTINLLGTTEFDLASSLTRLGVILILSVPTAYFSRESGKHRRQQYHFAQTALDLHAVNLYIDDLNDEIKHPLKAKIANRIFAAKNITTPDTDSFPINSHELFCKLIDKIDLLLAKNSEKPNAK